MEEPEISGIIVGNVKWPKTFCNTVIFFLSQTYVDGLIQQLYSQISQDKINFLKTGLYKDVYSNLICKWQNPKTDRKISK